MDTKSNLVYTHFHSYYLLFNKQVFDDVMKDGIPDKKM